MLEIENQVEIVFSKKWNNFSKKLKKNFWIHKYKPILIKIVLVLKLNADKSFLSLSLVKDKIVQVSFKKEFKKIYEPILWDFSDSFHFKRNCYFALKQKQVKKKMTSDKIIYFVIY